jgi:hypothetical protein
MVVNILVPVVLVLEGVEPVERKLLVAVLAVLSARAGGAVIDLHQARARAARTGLGYLHARAGPRFGARSLARKCIVAARRRRSWMVKVDVHGVVKLERQPRGAKVQRRLPNSDVAADVAFSRYAPSGPRS